MLAESFDLQVHPHGERLRLAFRGEVDLAAAPSVTLVGEAVQRTGLDVVLDLREVSFLDLAGAASIRQLARSLRSSGQTVSVAEISATASRWLGLMGLNGVGLI